MQLQARLVHADGQRRVVLVTAREGERVLGSALGEATGAEEAEDRALARLLTRLGVAPEAGAGMGRPPASLPTRLPPIEAADGPGGEPSPSPASAGDQAERSGVVASERAGVEAEPSLRPVAEPEPAPPEPPIDPEDWSAELAQLDLQLKRLGWSREEEAIFLQQIGRAHV
jgi:hypothetical protein